MPSRKHLSTSIKFRRLQKKYNKYKYAARESNWTFLVKCEVSNMSRR